MGVLPSAIENTTIQAGGLRHPSLRHQPSRRAHPIHQSKCQQHPGQRTSREHLHRIYEEQSFGRKTVHTASDGRDRSTSSNIPLSRSLLGRLSSNLGAGLLLLLLLNFFGIPVEEHVDHDAPGLGAGDGSTEAEDLTGKEPPDETDRVLALVVGGNGNIDELQGSVGIAKSDNGDVDVGSLPDSLVVNAGVGDDNETGLLERTSDVIGEGTGGEAAGDSLSTGVGGELEDSTVTVGTGRDHANVVGILNSGNDASGEDKLLPGLANVEDMDAYKDFC